MNSIIKRNSILDNTLIYLRSNNTDLKGQQAYFSSISKFKEDIISTVSQIEEKLTNQTTGISSQVTQKNEVVDQRITQLETQVALLTKQLASITIRTHHNDEAIHSYQKYSDLSVVNEIKLANLSKEISNACYKYDRIFIDNLNLPGEIGEYCRFRNGRECFEFILSQLNHLNSFKEKAVNEIKSVKEKLESINKNGNGQFQMEYDAMKKNYLINSMEEKLNMKIRHLDEEIGNIRLELDKILLTSSMGINSQCSISDYNILKGLKEEKDKQGKEYNETIEEFTNNYKRLNTDIETIRRKYEELEGIINDIKSKQISKGKGMKKDKGNAIPRSVKVKLNGSLMRNKSFDQIVNRQHENNEKEDMIKNVNVNFNDTVILLESKKSNIDIENGSGMDKTTNGIPMSNDGKKGKGKKHLLLGKTLNHKNSSMIMHKKSHSHEKTYNTHNDDNGFPLINNGSSKTKEKAHMLKDNEKARLSKLNNAKLITPHDSKN